MGLETGDKISDLNPAWPLGSDPKSQGDDHLRLLKAVFQNDVVSAQDGGVFNGDVEVFGDVIISRNNDLPFLRLIGQSNGLVYEVVGASSDFRLNVDRDAIFGQTAKFQFQIAGVNCARIIEAGDFFNDPSTVATREKGDGRWAFAGLLELLLTDLVGSGAISEAQRAALLAFEP